MESGNEINNHSSSIEERRLRLDEKHFQLENSFAKKWLPAFATLMVALIAAMFSFVQQQNSIRATERARYDAIQATERARIETQVKDEREWGFKVVEMYFTQRELFDLTKNTEQAVSNLNVLVAVAPKSVQGVLDAEKSRIPPPSGIDDSSRLRSLAAVAGVQDALAKAKQSNLAPGSSLKPSDFVIYIQYPVGGRDTAVKTQSLLANLGYRVPGIEQVSKVPPHLQVRYYRPDQRSYAEELANELGKELNLPVSPNNATLVISSKELPSGILEVWLPLQ
jgi:hypothetical protein